MTLTYGTQAGIQSRLKNTIGFWMPRVPQNIYLPTVCLHEWKFIPHLGRNSNPLALSLNVFIDLLLEGFCSQSATILA